MNELLICNNNYVIPVYLNIYIILLLKGIRIRIFFISKLTLSKGHMTILSMIKVSHMCMWPNELVGEDVDMQDYATQTKRWPGL